jgi:hypothetical protein
LEEAITDSAVTEEVMTKVDGVSGSKNWNRSSALTAEDHGRINTAVAAAMVRAGRVKEECSLSDAQALEFYEAINRELNVKIEEVLKAKQKTN